MKDVNQKSTADKHFYLQNETPAEYILQSIILVIHLDLYMLRAITEHAQIFNLFHQLS